MNFFSSPYLLSVFRFCSTDYQPSGTWTHYCATYPHTGQLELFRNLVSVGSVSSPLGITSIETTVYFGTFAWNVGISDYLFVFCTFLFVCFFRHSKCLC